MPLLENLSVHERLYIWRSRKNIDQVEAAQWHKTTPRVYGKWERNENTRSAPRTVQINSELTSLEQCILLRRRAGETQRQTAKKMNVSICWFKLMEWDQRPTTDLLAYWGVA